jgi:serine/threonine protein kinase
LEGTGIFRAVKDYTQFEYTAEADVYSFAMVCYEILSGEEPFEGHQGFDFLIWHTSMTFLARYNSNDPLNMLTC